MTKGAASAERLTFFLFFTITQHRYSPRPQQRRISRRAVTAQERTLKPQFVIVTGRPREVMMNVSQTMETEEDYLTNLQIRLYHPQQRMKGMFSLLPVGRRVRQDADDPLRMGRDGLSCALALADQKVSRKQLSLQAFHAPQRPGMFFSIQNLSKKGRLLVNGSGLGYLERLDLPDKALVRFGEYEMEVVREAGEARGSFEVELDVLEVSPFTERCSCVPDRSPVMDSSAEYTTGLRSREPLETDETLPYHT